MARSVLRRAGVLFEFAVNQLTTTEAPPQVAYTAQTDLSSQAYNDVMHMINTTGAVNLTYALLRVLAPNIAIETHTQMIDAGDEAAGVLDEDLAKLYADVGRTSSGTAPETALELALVPEPSASIKIPKFANPAMTAATEPQRTYAPAVRGDES